MRVAHRFGRAGYRVDLAARSAARLTELASELHAAGIDAATHTLDLTDPEQVRRTVSEVGEDRGRIDVLHFNPSAFRMADPLSLTPAELFEDLAVGVAPLLPAVQAARPYLSAGGRVLVTGSLAADKPWNRAASLGIQKAAVRNLVTSLDTTLAPDGIRAVAVQVNGTLSDEGPFSPGPVADALCAAALRDDTAWTAHVEYDG